MIDEMKQDNSSATIEEKTNNGPGAPIGNLNAWKHGRYSKRKDIILTCRTCALKDVCSDYNDENKVSPCVYEQIDRPNLSDLANLCDFLRELIETDYMRYRRSCNFEILEGGRIDSETTKLSKHIKDELYTLGRLSEIGELEKRVEQLEQRIGG